MVDEGGYRPFPSFDGWSVSTDLGLVRRSSAALQQVKRRTDPENLARAVRIATRYAAVDTGAIEGLYQTNRGFTRTIALQTATWEAALQSRGSEVARSIQDALDGYEYVLDAVTQRHPVTQTWIRELHAVLCRHQETYTVHTSVGPQRHALPTGRYKSWPNSPTNADTGRMHHYAPPDATQAEMARLVDELAGEAFSAAHPALQTAYAHYAFVCIHPFADGNGRVARALASVYLYRAPGVPLVVFADQKDRYLDALEAADAGRPDDFVGFIAQRAVDAVELVRLHLDEGEQASQAVAELASLLSGDPQGQASRAADRFVVLLSDALRTALDALALPEPVRLRFDVTLGRSEAPSPEAVPFDTPCIDLALTTGVPRFAAVGRRLSVWAAGDPGRLLLGGGLPLELAVHEVVPLESEVARLKVRAWADREAAALVRELSTELRS